MLCIQTLAGFSSWIDIFLIFSVPAFIWKSSPSEIALVAALYGLPSLVIGPIFGAFLDRNDPRKLMLLGAFSRTLLTLLIAFSSSYEIFAILVFLKGLANLTYWPSSTIVTNQAIQKGLRVSYFSTLSALDQFAKVITPMLAGILALKFPSQLIFLVSAALTSCCFFLVLNFAHDLDFQEKKDDVRDVKSLIANLIEGFRSFSKLPNALLMSMSMTVGISLSLAIYDPHLASFISSKGFDATIFSIVVSSTAAGAIAAAIAVRLLLKDKTAGFLMRSGVVIFNVAIFSSASIITIAPIYLNKATFICLWFINGFGYELFTIGASVNIQNLCPQHLLGRVSTSLRSASTAAIVLAPSFGALLIAEGGRSMPFIASAVLSLLILGMALLWRKASTDVMSESNV